MLYVHSNAGKKTLMNIIEQSRLINGRTVSPPDSPACSAWGRCLGVALLLLAAVPSYAGARQILDNDTPTAKSSKFSVEKFSVDLAQHGDGSGMVTVIVQHRQMPTAAHLKTMQGRGATIKSKFPTIRAVTMRVPASMLAELAKDPNVTYITPDRQVRTTANPETEEFATAVEADVAASQYALDGTGVGVAVIDSGISCYSDLRNASGVYRVVYSRAFSPATAEHKIGTGTEPSWRA